MFELKYGVSNYTKIYELVIEYIRIFNKNMFRELSLYLCCKYIYSLGESNEI